MLQPGKTTLYNDDVSMNLPHKYMDLTSTNHDVRNTRIASTKDLLIGSNMGKATRKISGMGNHLEIHPLKWLHQEQWGYLSLSHGLNDTAWPPGIVTMSYDHLQENAA